MRAKIPTARRIGRQGRRETNNEVMEVLPRYRFIGRTLKRHPEETTAECLSDAGLHPSSFSSMESKFSTNLWSMVLVTPATMPLLAADLISNDTTRTASRERPPILARPQPFITSPFHGPYHQLATMPPAPFSSLHNPNPYLHYSLKSAATRSHGVPSPGLPATVSASAVLSERAPSAHNSNTVARFASSVRNASPRSTRPSSSWRASSRRPS